MIARWQNTDTFNGLQIAKILFRRLVEDPVAKSDLNQEYSEDLVGTNYIYELDTFYIMSLLTVHLNLSDFIVMDVLNV